MPTQPINLVKGDKSGSDTDYRDNLPVNMVAIMRDMLGVSGMRDMFRVAGYMIQYPGLKLFSQLDGTCRGGVWNERFNDHFRVNGTNFYSIDQFGNSSNLGSVLGVGAVSFAESFNTQSIVAGGKQYLYDPTNGLRENTDTDLGQPIDHVWTNNRYFFTDGEFIYHTNAGSDTEIDPLKFATAEFMPDKTLGVAKTQDNKVVVFGRFSMEYFRDAANANFAYTRIESRAIKVGIVGTHCKTETMGKFYILGGEKGGSVSCYAASVGAVQKIATREVEKRIKQYTESELSNSVVENYTQDGYTYIVYHLPNETLVFNATSAQKIGMEQAWTILQTNDYDNYRGIHYVMDLRINQFVLGDKLNGNLGLLDDKIATQYDELSTWNLYSPIYYMETASIDSLQVETLPGFNDQGDATISISLNYDGVNYSKNWFPLYGKKANYNKRLIINRLGYVRDNISFKLRGKTRSRMAFKRAFITYG